MIPFQTIDWNGVEKIIYKGETGEAVWQTLLFGNLRIRLVGYSEGYTADHWCEKGHLIFCLEGELTTELHDGTKYILRKDMSYIVSDNESKHRSSTNNAVKLLIIDGAFLNNTH